MLTYVGIHLLENSFYHYHQKKWTVLHELVSMFILSIGLVIATYLYNMWVINQMQPNLLDLWYFGIHFALPFLPFIVPLFVILRQHYGEKHTNISTRENQYLVTGVNKNESLEFTSSAFLYAQAQQNYVAIFLIANQELEQHLIRNTLSAVHKQLPFALQVHRSFIINPHYLQSIEGNTRKRQLLIKHLSSPLPLSQKFYHKTYQTLTNLSQKAHLHP